MLYHRSYRAGTLNSEAIRHLYLLAVLSESRDEPVVDVLGETVYHKDARSRLGKVSYIGRTH